MHPDSYLSSLSRALVVVGAPGDVMYKLSPHSGVRGWQARGWQTKDGKLVATRIEWEALLEAASRHRITPRGNRFLGVKSAQQARVGATSYRDP
jgi:hypothetical protein